MWELIWKEYDFLFPYFLFSDHLQGYSIVHEWNSEYSGGKSSASLNSNHLQMCLLISTKMGEFLLWDRYRSFTCLILEPSHLSQ